jgi:serine/threonine protein kinase
VPANSSFAPKDNVLVDRTGRARLADFGLSRVLADETLWVTNATKAPGTARWMAPELLDQSQSTVTISSDIYAFAMTSYVRAQSA